MNLFSSRLWGGCNGRGNREDVKEGQAYAFIALSTLIFFRVKKVYVTAISSTSSRYRPEFCIDKRKCHRSGSKICTTLDHPLNRLRTTPARYPSPCTAFLVQIYSTKNLSHIAGHLSFLRYVLEQLSPYYPSLLCFIEAIFLYTLFLYYILY